MRLRAALLTAVATLWPMISAAQTTKQITDYNLESPLSQADNFLIQPGPKGMPYTHGTLGGILGLLSGYDLSASTSTATNGTTPRSLAERAADVVNVMDFGAVGDSTTDDAAAINAAIGRAELSSGAAEVFFPAPPGGFYAICSAPVTLPGGTATLRLVGAAAGNSMIRVRPGCGSPPAEVVYQGSSVTWNDTTRVTLSHLTLDGYCVATYDLYVGSAVGFSVDHTVFRNVATGGANVRLAAGYQYDIGNTNTAENVNDTGHTCYSSASALPSYNLWTSATDSRFDGLVAVDAYVANFYQDSGGNNRFIGAHAWNYVNPTDLRGQYGFSIVGSAAIIGSYAEDFTKTGIYLQGSSGFSGARVIGDYFDFTGNPANTVLGVEIASGITYAEVIGNSAWQLKYIGYPQNIVQQDGSADPSTLVLGNQGATYAAGAQPAMTINTTGLATSQVGLTATNPTTASYGTLQVNLGWGAGNVALLAQRAGTNSGGYFLIDAPNSSGSNYPLIDADGQDGLVALGGTIGGEALRAVYVASAVNRVEVQGATTGNSVTVKANGPDTNITLNIAAKGTGSIIAQSAFQHYQTTVSALPACSGTNKGAELDVTDASSPSWGASLTGGGSTLAVALCTGSAWVAH